MSLARSSLISYVTIGPRGPTCYRASQKNASGCQTMAAVETVQALSGRSKSAELTGSRYSFQQRDFGHPLRGFDRVLRRYPGLRSPKNAGFTPGFIRVAHIRRLNRFGRRNQ